MTDEPWKDVLEKHSESLSPVLEAITADLIKLSGVQCGFPRMRWAVKAVLKDVAGSGPRVSPLTPCVISWASGKKMPYYLLLRLAAAVERFLSYEDLAPDPKPNTEGLGADPGYREPVRGNTTWNTMYHKVYAPPKRGGEPERNRSARAHDQDWDVERGTGSLSIETANETEDPDPFLQRPDEWELGPRKKRYEGLRDHLEETFARRVTNVDKVFRDALEKGNSSLEDLRRARDILYDHFTKEFMYPTTGAVFGYYVPHEDPPAWVENYRYSVIPVPDTMLTEALKKEPGAVAECWHRPFFA